MSCDSGTIDSSQSSSTLKSLNVHTPLTNYAFRLRTPTPPLLVAPNPNISRNTSMDIRKVLLTTLVLCAVLTVCDSKVRSRARKRHYRRCKCNKQRRHHRKPFLKTYQSWPSGSPWSTNPKRDTVAVQKRQMSTLQFKPCDEQLPDKVVDVTMVDVHPMPIRTPGTMYFSIRLNVTRDLKSSLTLSFSAWKKLYGIDVRVPCVAGFGSCEYKDVCQHLEPYKKDPDACPYELRANNLPCSCPIKAGSYALADLDIKIPKLRGSFLTMAEGEYTSQIRLYEESENRWERKQLGCLAVSFAITKNRRTRGWLWR